MPLEFTCPHCGHRTDVPDEFSGRTGPCASCGHSITIPPIAGAAGYPADTKSTGGAVLIAAIVAAVVAVLTVCGGIGTIAFWRMSRMGPPPGLWGGQPIQRCTNNLKQIGLAMHNYHDVYGTFPPAYLADEDGQPMHSWRVLILPFLEQQRLYDQYDFDEPWDSPANLPLAGMIPDVYRCPDDTTSGYDETSYAMIVGPGLLSDGPGANKIRNITDGTSNTIMVVEAAESGINWMEPRDLDGQQISYQINLAGPGEIYADHPGGAHVLMCDATVRYRPEATDPEQIKAISTIAGGEPVVDY